MSMDEPIKPGDECIVIRGFTQGKSPNVGKRVTVGARQHGLTAMEERFGPVFLCTGPEVYQMDDGGAFVNAGWANFPAAWLQKAPKGPPEVAPAKKELTA
jgi:hypothetical protein